MFFHHLLFILILIISASSFTDATWEVSIPGSTKANPSMSETRVGLQTSGGSVSFFARSTTAKFRVAMQYASSGVFPQQCTSNFAITEQPYGWERWKYDLMREGVSVTVNRDRINVNLFPRAGYAITANAETITCCGFDPFVIGESIRDEDKCFSFSITRTPRVSVALYRTFDLANENYVPFLSIDPESQYLDEGTIRDEGLRIYIGMTGDNFASLAKAREAASYIKCSGGPGDCFAGGLVVDSSQFTWDGDNAPCVVQLDLTREQTRTFDISAQATVTLTLPNNGMGFGLKTPAETGLESVFADSTTNTFFIRTSTRGLLPREPVLSMYGGVFQPDASVIPPTIRRQIRDTTSGPLPVPILSISADPLANNIMTITEACLRGKVSPLTQTCNRSVLMVLPSTTPQLQRFGLSSKVASTTRDIYYHTMSSAQSLHPFSEMPWFQGPWDQASPPVGGWQGWEDTRSSGEGTQAMLKLAPLPAYETWLADTITVTLPFSAFTMLEPPQPANGQPLRLRVLPSPGELTASLRDIEQREIWRTELVQHLILDGESWTVAAVAGLVAAASGSIVPPALGFNTQKSTIMDPSLVSFGVVPKTGRINTTVMVIQFKMNPEYMMQAATETICFPVNQTWVRSSETLAIANASNKCFQVAKSPAELTIEPTPWIGVIEESEMIGAGLNLSLTLAGDTWTVANLDACKAALCASWGSTSTLAADPGAWVARRGAICNAANMSLRANQRTLDMTLLPDAGYNTKKGEAVTIIVPAVCSVTGTVAPVGNFTLEVLPQNGNVSFYVSYDRGVTAENLTEISEGDLREGRASIYMMTSGDNWDEGNAAAVSSSVFGALQSGARGSYGWNAKKAAMLGPSVSNSSLMVVDAGTSTSSNITFNVHPVPTFDLAANETVTLNLDGWWMSSGRMPQVPSISFKIYASPGVVELTQWLGSSRRVTEDDMRWGRVWFEFRIIGEQWRRDTAPFVRSFSSNDTAPTALNALIGSLIPAIRFFKFTVDSVNGYEYMRLTLQSQHLYDIDQPENITIALDSQTAVSGLQPMFDVVDGSGNKIRQRTMSFIIYPSAARVLLSGAVDLLNEKKMRQSKLTWIYITLIGDTWANFSSSSSSAPSSLLSDIVHGGITSLSPTGINNQGFRGYSSSVLPSAGSVERIDDHTIRDPDARRRLFDHVLLVKFVPDRRYKLDEMEKIGVSVSGAAVSSGIAPVCSPGRPGVLYVDTTGGELRLANESFFLTEAILRSYPVTVTIAIDGGKFLFAPIAQNKTQFLRGSGAIHSASSVIAEPHGFTKNKQQLLDTDIVLGSGQEIKLEQYALPSNSSSSSFPQQRAFFSLPEDQLISFALAPVRSFNDRNNEHVLFTARDPALFGSGIVADPSTVLLPIRKEAQVIVLLIDQSRSFARTYQTDPLALRTRIASLFALPLSRVTTQPNKPAFIQNLLAMQFWFADNADIGTAGYPDNAYLTDTFMSLSAPYLYSTLAVRLSFFEGHFDSAQFVSESNTTTPLSTPIPSPSFIFGIIGGVVILLGAIAFAVGLVLQKARVSISALRPSSSSSAMRRSAMDEEDTMRHHPDGERRKRNIKDFELELLERETRIRADVDPDVVRRAQAPLTLGNTNSSGNKKSSPFSSPAPLSAGRLERERSNPFDLPTPSRAALHSSSSSSPPPPPPSSAAAAGALGAGGGIQVTQAPMSMREFVRLNMAKESGGQATMGLDALGLSPNDIRRGGGGHDDDDDDDHDHEGEYRSNSHPPSPQSRNSFLAQRQQQQQQQPGRVYSNDAARARKQSERHQKSRAHDSMRMTDHVADL